VDKGRDQDNARLFVASHHDRDDFMIDPEMKKLVVNRQNPATPQQFCSTTAPASSSRTTRICSRI
jgi:dipeptidyl aminopeptidase/acylaminoacyl peptidase